MSFKFTIIIFFSFYFFEFLRFKFWVFLFISIRLVVEFMWLCLITPRDSFSTMENRIYGDGDGEGEGVKWVERVELLVQR